MNSQAINFRRLLELRGSSQSEIAEHFDISTAAVAQWAKKGIPANRVMGISKLLDEPPSVVEQCVYKQKQRGGRERSDYLLRAMDGSAFEKEQLIKEISNRDFTTADLYLLRRMVERLSLN
jgi:transcriptional regulator with XRE-family HTH domain